MSDDNNDDEKVPDEDLDDEELDEDLPDDDLDGDDAVVVVAGTDDDDDDEDEGAATPAATAAADDDDENDDDEDDVEADLDTILKDRLESGEDIDDDDEDEEKPVARPEVEPPEGVSAKREGEFTCQGCFIIVHPRQFGRRSAPVCPEGFEDCPSLELVRRES